MIVLTFLLLVLVLGALVDVVRAPRTQIKRGSKPGWLLTILLLPVIGGAMWFAFGRRRGDYDLDVDDVAEDREPFEPARATEQVRSVEAPALQHDPEREDRPRTTEEQLADLEAEIAYWESRNKAPTQPPARASDPL